MTNRTDVVHDAARDRRAALREAMLELRAEYLRELPTKLGELAERIGRARADATCLGGARSSAHALRGTAGSYGFAAISGIAARIEDTLVAMAERRISGAQAWEDIDQALASASGALDAAAQGADAW